MIEDLEFRDLFKVESGEHLQRLDEGLLRLEKTPHDPVILEELFREAHSMKGAARMLGLTDIEVISHHLEEILDAVRINKIYLSSNLLDQIYPGLEAIRKLTEEAVTGKPANLVTSLIVTQLKKITEAGSTEEPTSDSNAPILPLNVSQPEETGLLSPLNPPPLSGPVEQEMKETPAPVENQDEGEGEPGELQSGSASPETQDPKTGIEEFHIDTIRVDTRKLDALMTQVGELSVAKIRAVHRLGELEAILNLWEELNRAALSLLSHRIERESKSATETPRRALNQTGDEIELLARLGVLLRKARNGIYDDSSRLEFIANELEEGIHAVRLLPFSTIFNFFPRMVRDISREQSKEVQLLMEGGEITADKRIIEEIKDPLMHLIRNAIDHGIEKPDERKRLGKPRFGTILLKAYKSATNIVIEVRDDGRGLDIKSIKRAALKLKIYREDELAAMSPAQMESLILLSGFSTSSFVSDVSGRGVGLDVVRANVERLKGSVHVESVPGKGCTLGLQLPMTLATTRVLIASAMGMIFALPVEYVQTTRRVTQEEVFTMEGREVMVFDNQPIVIVKLSDLLELGDITRITALSEPEKGQNRQAYYPCIIMAVDDEKLGLIVDTLLDEQEIVLKPQSGILERVRNVSGATILGTGEVCMVLNPQDLIKSGHKRKIPFRVEQETKEAERKKAVLMAEDSITTRTQMKRILEGAGYEVEAAVDGLDALNKLSGRPFDALVTDIMMPNMDGLTLTAKVREDKRFTEIPIILVTSLASDEDKKRGLEAGANAYITKPAFDQKVLLDTLRRLM